MRFKKGNFISHANRGMSLEYDLNITNNYYLDNNLIDSVNLIANSDISKKTFWNTLSVY